jgi:hypothetical protein
MDLTLISIVVGLGGVRSDRRGIRLTAGDAIGAVSGSQTRTITVTRERG